MTAAMEVSASTTTSATAEIRAGRRGRLWSAAVTPRSTGPAERSTTGSARGSGVDTRRRIPRSIRPLPCTVTTSYSARPGGVPPRAAQPCGPGPSGQRGPADEPDPRHRGGDLPVNDGALTLRRRPITSDRFRPPRGSTRGPGGHHPSTSRARLSALRKGVTPHEYDPIRHPCRGAD
jgi:hypothetical protein